MKSCRSPKPHVRSEEEKDYMDFTEPLAVLAYKDNGVNFHNFTVRMINALKMNDNWKHIPNDTEYVEKMLKAMIKKIKKSPTWNKASKRKRADDNEKRSSKKIKSSGCRGGPLVGVPQLPMVEGRVLVMKRKLVESDINVHQQRLSMPCKQSLEGECFLSKEEMRKVIKTPYLPIKVVDPANRMHDAHLRLTKAGGGKNAYSYAIGKPWNDIKKDNGFKKNMVIKIWSFRGEGGQLCLQLERVNGEETES